MNHWTNCVRLWILETNATFTDNDVAKCESELREFVNRMRPSVMTGGMWGELIDKALAEIEWGKLADSFTETEPTMQERFDRCCELLIERGFTLSASSYFNDDHAYAFSRETNGPRTFNHPTCTVHFSPHYGQYTVNNQTI